MFGMFKKQVHDPVQLQHADLKNEPIGPMALGGEDCDELAGASGPLGLSANSPIPVNGLIGTYKYLAKLCTSTGSPIYFHRIGSVRSDIAKNPVDAYELVGMNDHNWDVLFLDMYHPRRSNKTPPGYVFKPYHKQLKDIYHSFGVDIACERFPYDLPEVIQSRNGWEPFARRVRERVSAGGFDRPETQELKVQVVRTMLSSRR